MKKVIFIVLSSLLIALCGNFCQASNGRSIEEEQIGRAHV